MTRSPSFDGFVDRFSRFSFLPPDYPSYRVLTFTLVGLLPTECASLRWTHQHAGLSRRSPCCRQTIQNLCIRVERAAWAIITRTHGTQLRYETRSLRDPIAAW